MKPKQNFDKLIESLISPKSEEDEITEESKEEIQINSELIPNYLMDPSNSPLDLVFVYLIQQGGSFPIDDLNCFIPIVTFALDLSNLPMASMGLQILNLYKNKYTQPVDDFFKNFEWIQLSDHAEEYFTDIFNDYCIAITNLSLSQCLLHPEYMNIINQSEIKNEEEFHLYLNLIHEVIINYKPQFIERTNFDEIFNNMQQFLLDITESTYAHFLDVFQGMFGLISSAEIFLPGSIQKIYEIYDQENIDVAKPLSEIMISLTKLDIFTQEQLDNFSIPEFILNPENYCKAEDIVKQNILITITNLLYQYIFTPQLLLESGILDYVFENLFQNVSTLSVATKFFLALLCYTDEDELNDFYISNGILNEIFENLGFYSEKDLLPIFRTMLKGFQNLTIDHPIVSEINTCETRDLLEDFYEEFSEKISKFENEKRFQSDSTPISAQHENAHSLADCIYDAATMIQYFLDDQED